MKNIQTNFNLSQRTTLGIASTLRKVAGSRSVVEGNLKRKLYENIHSVDDFLEIKHFDFEKGQKMI